MFPDEDEDRRINADVVSLLEEVLSWVCLDPTLPGLSSMVGGGEETAKGPKLDDPVPSQVEGEGSGEKLNMDLAGPRIQGSELEKEYSEKINLSQSVPRQGLGVGGESFKKLKLDPPISKRLFLDAEESAENLNIDPTVPRLITEVEKESSVKVNMDPLVPGQISVIGEESVDKLNLDQLDPRQVPVVRIKSVEKLIQNESVPRQNKGVGEEYVILSVPEQILDAGEKQAEKMDLDSSVPGHLQGVEGESVNKLNLISTVPGHFQEVQDYSEEKLNLDRLAAHQIETLLDRVHDLSSSRVYPPVSVHIPNSSSGTDAKDIPNSAVDCFSSVVEPVANARDILSSSEEFASEPKNILDYVEEIEKEPVTGQEGTINRGLEQDQDYKIIDSKQNLDKTEVLGNSPNPALNPDGSYQPDTPGIPKSRNAASLGFYSDYAGGDQEIVLTVQQKMPTLGGTVSSTERLSTSAWNTEPAASSHGEEVRQPCLAPASKEDEDGPYGFIESAVRASPGPDKDEDEESNYSPISPFQPAFTSQELNYFNRIREDEPSFSPGNESDMEQDESYLEQDESALEPEGLSPDPWAMMPSFNYLPTQGLTMRALTPDSCKSSPSPRSRKRNVFCTFKVIHGDR